MKVKVKKRGKAQEEKRRLTEELLRERRQLEARSFADLRKREQEILAAEQVQEEAAVAVAQCEETEVVAAVTQCEEPEDVNGGRQYEDSEATETIREAEQITYPVQEEEKKGAEYSYERLMRDVLAEYLA